MKRTILATLVTTALLVVATTSPAQGYRQYENAAHGFRLKVPGFVEEQPLEPLEEQILAKWSGTRPGKLEGKTRDLDLVLVVARIAKAAVPKTESGKAAKPVLTSRKQLEREHLNGGTTIEEFLQRHAWVNQKRLPNTLSKPVKSAEGRTFDIYEVSSNRDEMLAIRAFTLEDDHEIFGLYASASAPSRRFTRRSRSRTPGSMRCGSTDALRCTDLGCSA